MKKHLVIRWLVGRFVGLCIGFFGAFLGGGFYPSQALALEMNWTGNFWSEYQFVHDYTMDSANSGYPVDPNRLDSNGSPTGYYIPPGGKNNASFQTLFLRMRPTVTVNDNIYIKSEWWVGNPIYGIFGSGLPYSVDQTQYFSTFSRGSTFSVQRVWAEIVTDVGTVQVGRVPLEWGVGIVWNKGENLWSRYMSTADAVRLIAKFGSFTLIPSFIVPSTGNTIGGSCAVGQVSAGVFTCTPGSGAGGVNDYSLILKYESMDEALEGGVNIIRRLAGSQQQSFLLPGQIYGSMNFMTYDFFAKKSFQDVSIAAEVPVATGSMGDINYQAFAIATEANWKTSEVVQVALKAGYAPGQDNTGTGSIDMYRAFYFHPNYHIGMIMFNYQLRNFSGVQTTNNINMNDGNLSSPYYNPIVDAAYFALSTDIKPSYKWTLRPSLIYAVAPRAAQAGYSYFNYWDGKLQANNAGVNQGNSLGWEFDFGVSFQWDEHFLLEFDNGIFVPGSFYAFSNVAGVPNSTDPVFASAMRLGLSF